MTPQSPMFQVQQFTTQTAELLVMEMMEVLALGMAAGMARSFAPGPALQPFTAAGPKQKKVGGTIAGLD